MKLFTIAKGNRFILYHLPNQLNILPQIELFWSQDGSVILTLAFITLELNIELF